jgi:hypothetical protein
MPRFVRGHIGLVIAAVAFAACSDSPTSPSSGAPDIAALLSEMSPASLGIALGLASSIGGDLTRFPTSDPGKCSYSSATGFFVCPTVTSGSLTFTSMYRLIDAAGNSQSKPDGLTSAIETKTTISGTISSTVPGSTETSGSYTIDGVTDHTLSGIRSDTHVLNGGSTMIVQGSIQVGTTTIPIDDKQTETTSNLVLPSAKKGQRWPQSGTITIDEVSNPSDPQLADTNHVVITFNGTSVVTLTLSNAFGTFTCHFDLAPTTSSGGLGACVPSP